MKRIALCFVLLPLIFSCDINNWADTVIENKSEFNVTFRFSNTSQIDIAIGGQATFPTEAYQRLESYTPEKRVYFTYSSTNDDYTGEFRTRESWSVKVNNAIGQAATLSADDWMDSIDNIPSGDQSGNAAYQKKVYTDKPNFTVTTSSGFPAVAVYNRDSAAKDFLVTIQWSK